MTDVVHGLNPQFRVPLAPGPPYRMTIEGHYSQLDGWTAAGVLTSEWQSQKPEKRRAELLGMRSAFIDWFLIQWVAQNGSFDDGVLHLVGYPLENHRERAMRGAAE